MLLLFRLINTVLSFEHQKKQLKNFDIMHIGRRQTKNNTGKPVRGWYILIFLANKNEAMRKILQQEIPFMCTICALPKKIRSR